MRTGIKAHVTEFVSIKDKLPPENKNILVILESTIPILGRNLDGRFCQYNPEIDRFVEWMPEPEDGFRGIALWAEIVVD